MRGPQIARTERAYFIWKSINTNDIPQDDDDTHTTNKYIHFEDAPVREERRNVIFLPHTKDILNSVVHWRKILYILSLFRVHLSTLKSNPHIQSFFFYAWQQLKIYIQHHMEKIICFCCLHTPLRRCRTSNIGSYQKHPQWSKYTSITRINWFFFL